jgi:serine/threonine protein kinase
MFSPHFKKPVLIDFGFSEIIKEELGEKTLTNFRGSPAFCSDEMTKLIGSNSRFNFIDAYFNDLHGLSLSIGHL